MGESTYVNTNSRARAKAGDNETGAAQSGAKRMARARAAQAGVDWILIGTVLALVLFGLLMVYSAGPKFAMAIKREHDFFLKRQAIWAIVGLVAMFVASRFNYHWLRRLTVLIMIGTLAMLGAVALIGDTTLGSNRSIFSGSIRPSELAKLVTIIYMSVWLYAKREVLNDIFLGLVPLMVILGLTGGLILIQPDFSAAITVILLGGILFFLAGGEWRQIALVLVVSVLLGWLVVNVYPTGIKRIADYLAGLRDPLNASYHVQRSLEAIINGGFFGVGIGHGSTKFTGLPVAPTDSIFAVIAEEVGLLGAGAVIAAYVVILWRGLFIASRAKDQLGALLASGITIWLVIEAMLNMAVMVNLLPHAGNALPLISYGGSSLFVTLAGIGILLNVARMSDQDSNGGNSLGPVIDLRWRDRRRRVSRPGHPAGS
jgi:cell division protein FtsW